MLSLHHLQFHSHAAVTRTSGERNLKKNNYWIKKNIAELVTGLYVLVPKFKNIANVKA